MNSAKLDAMAERGKKKIDALSKVKKTYKDTGEPEPHRYPFRFSKRSPKED